MGALHLEVESKSYYRQLASQAAPVEV